MSTLPAYKLVTSILYLACLLFATNLCAQEASTAAQTSAPSVNATLRFAADELKNKGAAPHDLRRTFAKLAHKGGSAIDQIQLSLGHESI